MSDMIEAAAKALMLHKFGDEAELMFDIPEDAPAHIREAIQARLDKARQEVAVVAAVVLQAIPSPCDGNEQDAFEAWGRGHGFDIANQHPLHWLFLDPQTAAARNGWRGALEYVAESLGSALAKASPTDNAA